MKKLIGICALLLLTASGCKRANSLDKYHDQLRQYPRFSIVLEDMDREGNFFTEYYHKYKLAWTPKEGADLETRVTGWERVDEKTFDRYRSCLGMAVISKNDQGNTVKDCYPAGYQYVGDRRYGRWRTDRSGNTFWEFAGKYAVMRAIFDMGSHRVYRSEWDDYRSRRTRGQPYFGGGTFGTQGSLTKKTKPDFFQRRQAREAARRRSFSQKVRNRAGRSRSGGYRSRGGGFGK